MRTEILVDVASVDDGGAVRLRAVDESLHALDVLEVDVRADLRLLVARITLADHRGPLGEPRGERVGDSVLHQQAGPGEAHLASVVVLLDRQIDREIEVGIVEDHGGALATELE